MRRPIVLLSLAVLALASCSSSSGASSGTTVAPSSVATTTVLQATTDAPSTTGESTPDSSRPYDVIVPSAYVAGTPTPLVILLHGFGFDGTVQNAYFGMQAIAEQRGLLYVHPDGTKNQIDKGFWNATDACCGFGSKVDDVGYLTSIIDQVSAKYTVDPKRVFLIGHSNGAFMSYRMACDRSSRIAAIASLAGDTWLDTSKCAPSERVSVLQVQGTADETISYTGGEILGSRYPGARQTVATWARYDGCGTSTVASTTSFDYDANLPGNETTTESYTGCPPGVDVALWTINGGSHIPAIAIGGGAPLVSAMVDFLLAHPKP